MEAFPLGLGNDSILTLYFFIYQLGHSQRKLTPHQVFGCLEMQFACKARKTTDFLPSSIRFEIMSWSLRALHCLCSGFLSGVTYPWLGCCNRCCCYSFRCSAAHMWLLAPVHRGLGHTSAFWPPSFLDPCPRVPSHLPAFEHIARV